jgi:hypothetical protein
MPADISLKLIHGLESLKTLQKLELMHGDSIDKTIMALLIKSISCTEISKHEWDSSASKDGLFDEVTGDYISNIKFNTPKLINKPRGSQNTPDFMILYKHKGIAFESKSTKSQHIVWNSGIPKKNIIYIFNGHSTQSVATTYFMGKDIICDNEKKILLNSRKKMELAVSPCNVSLKKLGLWNVYPRPMYGCSEKILTTPSREYREQSVILFLRNFDWDNNKNANCNNGKEAIKP